MNPLLLQVEATIQKYWMLTPGERILVACSGGPDSVALFHLLRELAPPLGLHLMLLHFDHRLRKESKKDFEFVQAMAQRFRVPFYGESRKSGRLSFDKNLSPEENARKWRYEFFRQVVRKTRTPKIALGHHRDDQAETLLMRIIQGTGLRGLQGIRPMIEMNRLILVRPLIELSRTQIREFLKARSIPYREDPTNQSERFLRNRIRLKLLPWLEREFNPQIREALTRLAETASTESAGMEEWVRCHWKSFLRSRRNGTVWFDRERFLCLPSALQFRILDQALHSLDPKSGLDFESWRRIQVQLPKGCLRVTLPRKLDFRLTAKSLVLKR